MKSIFSLFSSVLIMVIFSFFGCENANKKDVQFTLPDYVSGSADTIPVFYIFGELSPEGYLDDENPVTEKYGFKVKRVAGCEIESEEREKILVHNREMYDFMTSKYGEDWVQVFENETDLKFSVPK